MSNPGAKYEKLNAMVTNTKVLLQEGSISLEDAKEILNSIYKEYKSLEEEEKNTEMGEVTDILISLWLSNL